MLPWLALSACAEVPLRVPTPIIGTFTMFNRQAPYLIAAPHGEYDENSGELVYDFCEQVRWDCLIAEGFRDERAPINVNRPTEGTTLNNARFTERATLVYAKYVKRIRRLSPRVRFYVEIHGHENASLHDTIEIASVGISPSQGDAIASAFDRALQGEGLTTLNVSIDVVNTIRYKASHARKFGVLSFISPAIHIELPSSVRTVDRDKMVRVLVRLLPELTKIVASQ